MSKKPKGVLGKNLIPLMKKPNTAYEKTEDSNINRVIEDSKDILHISNDYRHLIDEVIDFANKNNFSLQGTNKERRQVVYNFIRRKNNPLTVAQIKKLIEACVKTRGEPYAPVINDFKTLYRRYQDLIVYITKKGNNARKHYKII